MNRLILIIIVLFSICCTKQTTRESKNADNTIKIDSTTNKLIVFSTGADENSLIFHQGYCLYSEIFKKLGYTFEGRSNPTERSLILANNGQVDGEGGRIVLIDTLKYPNLVKINEPVFTVKLAAYSTNNKIKINSWQSFSKINNLSIGYIFGSIETSNEIETFVPKPNLINITDTKQGCAMLAAGRIDIFIDVYEYMEYYLKADTNLKHSDIACVGEIKQYKVYPCLNKKHAKLVPEFESVLKSMKSSGNYQLALKKGFMEYVSSNKNTY
jgi:polar amino acid transport system substrate-binding protein